MSAECPGPLNAGSWLGGCRWLHWLPQSRKNARLGEPSSITIASVEAIAKDQARHAVLPSQSVNRSTGPFQSFCSYQIRVTGPHHLLARGSAFMFSYQIRQPACPCASCYLFAVLPNPFPIPRICKSCGYHGLYSGSIFGCGIPRYYFCVA